MPTALYRGDDASRSGLHRSRMLSQPTQLRPLTNFSPIIWVFTNSWLSMRRIACAASSLSVTLSASVRNRKKVCARPEMPNFVSCAVRLFPLRPYAGYSPYRGSCRRINCRRRRRNCRLHCAWLSKGVGDTIKMLRRPFPTSHYCRQCHQCRGG